MQFSMLRDYRFEGDVDDMRGSLLYGVGGHKIARIQDVVFDNKTGDIRYLVANSGYGRNVLVPMDQASYSPERHAFFSEMSSENLARLPAFSERVLENEDQWRDYEQLYQTVLNDQQPGRSRSVGSMPTSGFERKLKRNLRQIQRESDQQIPRRRIA